MRPQGRSQSQDDNRVTRPLPRFITKTHFSFAGYRIEVEFLGKLGIQSGENSPDRRFSMPELLVVDVHLIPQGCAQVIPQVMGPG